MDRIFAQSCLASETDHLLVDTIESRVLSNKEGESSLSESKWLEHDESLAVWVKYLSDSKSIVLDEDVGKKNKKSSGRMTSEGFDMTVRNASRGTDSSVGVTDHAPRKGMLFPFQPLSLAFNHINYYVDMPTSVSAAKGAFLFVFCFDDLLWMLFAGYYGVPRDLSDNLLYEDIPFSISKLKQLELLNLKNNQLTGPIPSTLTQIPKLKTLDLARNQLIGEIPRLIYWNEVLQYLFTLDKLLVRLSSGGNYVCRGLRGNSLTGTLSPDMCQLTGLCDVRGNNLTGTIPDNIGNCTSFEILDISYNQISGEIPYNIGFLQVATLSLQGNRLTGKIPEEVTKKAQEEASEHVRCLEEDLGKLRYVVFISVQYKFFVDGEWRHDEHQPFVSGNYGVVNSVFLAREPDVIPASYTPETPGRSRTFHGVSKNAAYSNIATFLKRRKDTATAAASTFGTKRRKRN
ncbi:hypothetical protein HYC85_026838 [Camellia sinensis]|uniref:AMP-activated protein kinase glycogen-binding domain-containing protein n=1 Tax=Camellia sinensis TaxID=4442 RepID=A0A7J7G4R7_CAMSI|nr:hypothetical protein HYC85_026838 [Camellia sinensis]